MNARVALFLMLGVIGAAGAADLRLVLPLQRNAYQDNEWIDLTVARSSAQALQAGNLELALSGADGSRLTFVLAVPACSLESGQGQRVEHARLNAGALRPGAYALTVTCDGASAATNFTVHSHLRRTEFKLINWGRAKGREQLAQGEDSLGFNLFYGHYSADDDANLIRAGVDFMANCVMSGGHQMDLRTECDWSDPYVIRGGTRRVVRRAFIDRTRPHVWGVHFYDEPGLTWAKDPENGVFTAHAVPWQARSFEAAYGRPPLDWKKVDPANPEDALRWSHWARWKLGLMDAAWQDARLGVSTVKPGYVSVTQSQYGYSAFSDGYYFNVVRSLPVISGHGGYHDFGPGYFNPCMFLEFARARDLGKPNWYLPTWYGNTSADEFRLEQYLSFQCNLQGMIAPPDLEMGDAPEKIKAAQGIVESNHLLARLGPVCNHLPVTRPPVALLFSLSQMIHAQTLDRKVCYAHDTVHGRNVMFGYLAGKLLQHQFMPLLDEEVLEGTLAARHRAILLVSVDYLDAPVVAGLEEFIRGGGLVLLTADCTVKVKGGTMLDVAPAWPDAARIAALKQAGRNNQANDLMRLRQALAGAGRLAEAIRPHLERAGVRPPLKSSEPGIVVTRQASGDVEYLFVVNATHDPAGNPMLGIKAVSATLALPDDGRPVYDAVHGGALAGLVKDAGYLRGQFRFGPGQMRVWARTTRPVGGVQLAKPVLRREPACYDTPLLVELEAAMLDVQRHLLAGPVPLRVIVHDPLGGTRYDLYRATDGSSLKLTLPLALTDPPGEWRVTVTDLLNNTSESATFKLERTAIAPTAAGVVRRAVFWPGDRAHVFKFFRLHSQVTIVAGPNEFERAAADRLETILKPWNVNCTRLSATEAAKPRTLTEDEARTWIGLDYAGRGQIKPGASNSPVMAGFALRGPVILLGTPQDNPLIKFLADQRFLPYKPDAATMPGPGRGYVAWQLDGLGVNQESVTLLAYDAAGLSEAVGTLYEMMAGLEPLTPLAFAQSSRLEPASRAQVAPALKARWSVVLPDRVTGLGVDQERLLALTHDASLTELDAAGASVSQRPLEAAEQADWAVRLRPAQGADALATARKLVTADHLVKLTASRQGLLAVACWGGQVDVFDQQGVLKAQVDWPQDVTTLAWWGPDLVIGDADGRLSRVSLSPEIRGQTDSF